MPHVKIEKKVTEQFLSKCLQKWKKGKIFLSISGLGHLFMKLHAKKKRKTVRYWNFEIDPSPLKVDADTDDNGQLGIWKAPLPRGRVEIKREKVI